MKLRYKIPLSAAAVSVAVAIAVSSPAQFGLAAGNWQQREALSTCQQTSSAFFWFLASARDACYSRLRSATDEHSGSWSRHDRRPRQLAAATAQNAQE